MKLLFCLQAELRLAHSCCQHRLQKRRAFVVKQVLDSGFKILTQKWKRFELRSALQWILEFTAFEGDTRWLQAQTTHKRSRLPSFLWQLRSHQWTCWANRQLCSTRLTTLCENRLRPHHWKNLGTPGWSRSAGVTEFDQKIDSLATKLGFHNSSFNCFLFRVWDIPAQIGDNLWTGWQKTSWGPVGSLGKN